MNDASRGGSCVRRSVGRLEYESLSGCRCHLNHRLWPRHAVDAPAVTPTIVITEAKAEEILLSDLAMFKERVSLRSRSVL